MDFKYKYRVINLVLAGTESDVEFQLNGAAIFYHTSLNNTQIKVRLFDRANDQIPLNVKQQITAPFDKFYLTATAADTITLYVANPKEIKFEGISATVDTVNNLSRDDSFRYYSDQQKAFIGGHFWTGAASNYCMIELFNPSGSGKILYVVSARAAALYTGNYIYCNKVSTQLATPTAVTKHNKNFRGSPTASVANLQRKDDTTAPTTTDFFWVGEWYAAGTSFGMPIMLDNVIQKDPIVLTEGYGIRFSNYITAQALGGFFEWIEI